MALNCVAKIGSFTERRLDKRNLTTGLAAAALVASLVACAREKAPDPGSASIAQGVAVDSTTAREETGIAFGDGVRASLTKETVLVDGTEIRINIIDRVETEQTADGAVMTVAYLPNPEEFIKKVELKFDLNNADQMAFITKLRQAVALAHDARARESIELSEREVAAGRTDSEEALSHGDMDDPEPEAPPKPKRKTHP
jgi:hypothetical protein